MIDTTQTEREASEDRTDATETERANTEQTLTVCPEYDGRLEHDLKHGETACVECKKFGKYQLASFGPERSF